MNLHVRPERPEDAEAIDEVLQQAFGSTEESTLVRALRASDYFVPTLALVAEAEAEAAAEAEAETEQYPRRIIGYILFSRIGIETRDGEIPALALAPMAVLPEYQRQGVGTQLVKAGLKACRQRGYRIVVLVGYPEYYPRFGFTPARDYGLKTSFTVPDDAFMALELTPGALNTARDGNVQFSPPFDAVG